MKYFSFTKYDSQQDFSSSNFTFFNLEVFFYGKKYVVIKLDKFFKQAIALALDSGISTK